MRIRVNEGVLAANVTYDSAGDFKGVEFINKSTGSTVKIIGKFISFGGNKYIALDSGRFVTERGFRGAYQTKDDMASFDAAKYAGPIIREYLAQAKSLKFKVPSKDEYGRSNPRDYEFCCISPNGETYQVVLYRHTSEVEVRARVINSEPYRSQIVHLGKERLLKLGSPEEAAKAIVAKYALPDFPKAI